MTDAAWNTVGLVAVAIITNGVVVWNGRAVKKKLEAQNVQASETQRVVKNVESIADGRLTAALERINTLTISVGVLQDLLRKNGGNPPPVSPH